MQTMAQYLGLPEPEDEGWPAPPPLTQEELAEMKRQTMALGRRLADIQEEMIIKHLKGM